MEVNYNKGRMYPVEIVNGDRAVVISIDEARELQDNLAKAIKQAADEEEELTEFEKAIKDMGHSVMFMTTECIKQKAKELLELAKKELSEKGEIITLGSLPTYDIGFQNGKAEALKGLPKWKKTKPERGKTFGAGPWYGSGIMHDNGKHVVFLRGYEISVDELFDKLPKEE